MSKSTALKPLMMLLKKTQTGIQAAQVEIADAQKEVASLEKQINEQRAIVKRERDRDLGRLRSAEQSAANERRKVQSVQANIDAAHRAIASIDREVKAKDKWLNAGSNFIEVGARGSSAPPFFTQKASERTAKMTEIAGLESARFAADRVLLAAEKTVMGMHVIGNNVPIDADVRVAGLITTKEVPIATMEAAKLVLEGANVISTGALDAAKWIVENGRMGPIMEAW